MDAAVWFLDGLAALMIAALPAALLFWLLIHPFAPYWRKRGALVAYGIVSTVCLALVYALWTFREPLMRHHFGYRPLTIGLGTALFVCGALWDWTVLRKLSFPVLAGLPELSGSRASELLTDGPYSIVRHPRYLGALVGIVGFALICNYLWLYVVVVASIPVGWYIIVLEERELAVRFGAGYEEYSRRVPRFVPTRISKGFAKPIP